MFTNLLATTTMETVVTIISIIAVAGLFIAAVILSATQKKLGNKNAKAVVFGAIAVAMSFVLSYIAFYKMPFGGSITLASLVPLIIYAYCFGISRGLIVGLVYGLLQFIQGPFFINITQFILDYLLAFSTIAIAGCFKPIKNMKISLPLATLAVCFARLCFHILAGVMFYSVVGERAEILPSLISNIDALPAFVYALAYNSLYLVPDLIICVIVIILLTQNKVFVSKVKEMSIAGNDFSMFGKKKKKIVAEGTEDVNADVITNENIKNSTEEVTVADVQNENVKNSTEEVTVADVQNENVKNSTEEVTVEDIQNESIKNVEKKVKNKSKK